VDWLKLNQAQEILVPADVRFRIVFSCPYDDKWAPDNRPEVFHLREGAEADFGELKFDPALQVQVLVLGPDGKGIEGVPVRRLILEEHERAWSVPHNSDASGLASFYVPRQARGQFGVFGTPGQEMKALVDFQADKYSPDKPFRIELSKEQIEGLRGFPKRQ
jgi:hypothetical protein